MRIALLLTSIVVCSLALVLLASAQDSDKPVALLLEFEDQWTQTAFARDLLRDAGFDVQSLPLDISPFDIDADLIFIGSFASESPKYQEYMAEFGPELFDYVDHGHLLVQMTQADQFEATPPFLPTTHGATRADDDFARAYLLSPGHTMIRGIGGADGIVAFSETRTIWESFTFQSGFEVLLAGDENAQFPAMMEGAYGQGRILLCAMALDKGNMGNGRREMDYEKFMDVRKKFFDNLLVHTQQVNSLTAPALNITDSPRTVQEFVPGSWTLAVLPDTQVYSLRYPGLFIAQTGWLALNYDRLNIKYVLHLGDIVNNNSHYEWGHAHDAFRLINGTLPYALAPGNHDYGPSGDASTRDTYMNDYFAYEQMAAWPTFGGAYEQGWLDNTYHLFSAGGTDWIVLALEWAARDEVVAWANEVMENHPTRRGILITHSFVYNDDTRTDHTKPEGHEHYNPHEYKTPGGVNDGQELWDKLVKHHDFPLVISGHVLGDGTGYLEERNETGSTTYQMLANYQMRELGGEAYMRLLEFRPDGTVMVKSYSPLYDGYLLEPDQQFSFSLD